MPQKLQTSKNDKIYDNCSIYSPDGVLMCHCSRRRIKFYLKNNLADKLDDDKIKLKFNPKGLGHDKEHPYLLDLKKNQCVVCGTNSNLTRHHVVPKCFRNYIQQKFHKRFGHYDILLVCSTCHSFYDENHQKQFIQKLFNDNKIKIEKKWLFDKEISKVSSSAFALVKYETSIPQDRREHMENRIKAFFNVNVLTNDIIMEAMGLNAHIQNKNWESPYKQLLEKYDLHDFFILWREHFVKTMKPQFLLKTWEINAKLLY